MARKAKGASISDIAVHLKKKNLGEIFTEFLQVKIRCKGKNDIEGLVQKVNKMTNVYFRWHLSGSLFAQDQVNV